MGTLILDYFTNLFPEFSSDYAGVINLIEQVVSRQDNDCLLTLPSADETCRAVFRMHLGYDGINSKITCKTHHFFYIKFMILL